VIYFQWVFTSEVKTYLAFVTGMKTHNCRFWFTTVGNCGGFGKEVLEADPPSSDYGATFCLGRKTKTSTPLRRGPRGL